MKYIYTLSGFLFFAALFTGCGGNKNFEKNAPAQLGQAYFTTKENVMKLYIPVNAMQAEVIALDSVHFRGKKAQLQQEATTPGVYVAKFTTGKPDLIMSSDPREEYENKAPQITEKTSFDLKDHEAVLEYTQNGNRRYYRITGIKEGS